MDGCIIHMTWDLVNSILSAGALIRFLEPYDPQHMPVEIAFRPMKSWLRIHCENVQHLPMQDQIRLAADLVSCNAARNAFYSF